MNFMARPSKCFLFDVLEKKLSKITAGIGLDAASAGFKNRRMFKTEKYYGLDIDLTALEKGLQKYSSSNTFGVSCDLERLDLLPENSVDILVSTNTLYCLTLDKRVKAIQHICRLASPSGYLFCQLSVDEELGEALKIFEENFKDIKKIYYGNYVGRAYESFFKRRGAPGLHPLASARPFRLLAWLISRFEYLTCRFRKINKHVLVICSGKKDQGNANKFDLSNLPLIQDRLYNALYK